MTIANPATERRLRAGFKYLNKFMVLLFRLGLGSYGNGTRWGGSVMVLTHRGRKSGRLYRTPVNYARIDGDIYCAVGFGAKSDWYQNILVYPQVQVWLKEGWYAGLARDVTEAPDRTAILRQVMIASGFAAPLFGANPRKMSDDQIEELLSTYRLVRIKRSLACTGPGGPGDLAWVWPLATALLATGLLVRRRSRRRPPCQ